MYCPDTNGSCVVNFHGTPDHKADRKYEIVSTDYTSYTVVYDCYELIDFYYDFVWIMTRDPQPSEELMNKIRSEVQTNLSFYDFDKDFSHTK